MSEIYCTLLLTDGYLPGAQVLAHSLRDGGTTRKLAVLVTPGLSEGTIQELNRLYDYVLPVEKVTSRANANLALMGRPDLSSTFTKIHLWRLTQFSKIVYVDADIVALRAPDELFDVAADFAASPDIGWPDIFNSGLMVIKPDIGTYHALKALAERGISFDGADQGLLNMHFRDWHRLSFVYNVTPSGNYQYAPAYRHFQSSVTMIHFIGPNKPWIIGRATELDSEGSVYSEQLGIWWSKWDQHYRPLTEQDPSLQWDSDSSPPPPGPPGGYDPNFRRDHDAEDGGPSDDARPWSPPAKLGEAKGGQTLPPGTKQGNPYSAPKQDVLSYIAPMFLPKEFVPYVPREMPYSAYSQTQVPGRAHVNFRHHDEFKREETHYPGYDTEPERYFSAENREREEPSLVEDSGTEDLGSSSEAEDHPFEAPMNSWDPARFSPPPQSNAEASNFPAQVYSNRWDTNSDEKWKMPPVSAPPKNLQYELPKEPTLSSHEKPAAVFPWEERKRTPTTRVFDDEDEESEYEEEEETPTYIDELEETPAEKRANVRDEDPEVNWHRYSRQNAWDSIPEIDRYVATFQRNSRARTNTVRSRGDVTPNPVFRVADFGVRNDEIQDSSSHLVPPDLSVTPNPVRQRGSWRPSSMNDEGRYPSAKGVAEAHDWDPYSKLEELKQAPKLLLEKKSPPSPLPIGLGSPRSPGTILVSSSVPVPQLPFHITAYQQRHYDSNQHKKDASSSDYSSGAHSFPSPALSSASSNSTIMPTAVRPVARRYNHSATQTEKPPMVDTGTQFKDEEYEEYLRNKQRIAGVELAAAT